MRRQPALSGGFLERLWPTTSRSFLFDELMATFAIVYATESKMHRQPLVDDEGNISLGTMPDGTPVVVLPASAWLSRLSSSHGRRERTH